MNSSQKTESPSSIENHVHIVQTDNNAKDGQNKCPKCGSTDITLNEKTGKLRCDYCRYEFEPQKVEGLETDISKLQGQTIGSGAQDIVASTDEVRTFKCSSCGAEVVIDASSTTQARCHWCRNTLSLNQQIPNGAIPDVVLPFHITKEEAREEIKKFVKKRKFFAHPKFQKEFTTENIMGVYFPYMVIDINSHVSLKGMGEHLTRKYMVGSGDDREYRYDVDCYQVEREFDLMVDGLTIEANAERLDKTSSDKTNNVINAIMPFDIENCVRWDANYLKGYTSERRDTNVEDLHSTIQVQAKDIARFAANETLKEYDRGVAWKQEDMQIRGEQWKSAYLPVWLYSYQQIKGNKQILHYVAVNARTKEVMGSVPIHMPKLIGLSILVEILGIIAFLFVDSDYNFLFLLTGILYFLIFFRKYRNSNARHKYEQETTTQMENLRQVDRFVEHRQGLSNARIKGANNLSVQGQSGKAEVLDILTQQTPLGDIMNEFQNKDGS